MPEPAPDTAADWPADLAEREAIADSSIAQMLGRADLPDAERERLHELWRLLADKVPAVGHRLEIFAAIITYGAECGRESAARIGDAWARSLKRLGSTT